MKSIMKSILFSMGLLVSCFAAANPFATCLVDSLDGKERKQLAKWIFFAVAAHPEIKPYSAANEKDIEETDRYVGALVTRLLAEDCAEELKVASTSDPLALEKGFELVGQVAMQELMNDQDVMKSLINYMQYADQEKLKRVFSK